MAAVGRIYSRGGRRYGEIRATAKGVRIIVSFHRFQIETAKEEVWALRSHVRIVAVIVSCRWAGQAGCEHRFGARWAATSPRPWIRSDTAVTKQVNVVSALSCELMDTRCWRKVWACRGVPIHGHAGTTSPEGSARGRCLVGKTGRVSRRIWHLEQFWAELGPELALLWCRFRDKDALRYRGVSCVWVPILPAQTAHSSPYLV